MINVKNYTKASKEYGFLKIDDIIKNALQREPRIAFITEHSTLFSSYEFINECNKNGIKPVVGMTIKIRNDDNSHSELTIYANNKQGFSELSKLSYKVNIHDNGDKTFSIDDVLNLDPTNLTALANGNFLTLNDDIDTNNALKIKGAFGNELYFGILPKSSTVSDPNKNDNVALNEKIIEIKNKIGVSDENLIFTNENRFSKGTHYKYFITKSSRVVNKGRGFNYDQIKSTDFLADDDYNNNIRFNDGIQSKKYLDKEDIAKNMSKFASKFDKYSLDVSNLYLPKFKGDFKDILRERYATFIRDKFPADKYSREQRSELRKPYDKRIVEEINLIEKLGFSDYFMIFEDFARNNPDRNFVLRGSAISSLATHILGLSNIDPVENGLLFERFLNENRLSNLELPDIDVETDNVKEIVSYMQDKYGYDRFVSLSAENTMKAKSQLDSAFETIRIDVLNNPTRNGEDRIMPNDEYIEILNILKRSFASGGNTFLEELKSNQELSNYVRTNTNANILANLAILYEDQTTDVRRVPASFAIAPKDIDQIYSGFDSVDKKDGFKYKTVELVKDNIENLGMVKLDILSNRYLSQIIEFKKKYNIEVDLKNKDERVLRMLNNGHTTTINQLKSETQSRLTRNVGVDNFTDIVNIVALIRPAVEHSKRMEYQRNKRGGYRGVKHIGHIVEETKGIIIFDEQVMKIAQDFGGLSPAESDDFRGALKSNNTKKLADFYKKMKVNAQNKNISDYDFNQTVNLINSMAGKYTFSKAHSLAYSNLIYEQAYIKEHYPAEYMSVFLSDSPRRERDAYINELKFRNIEILKVDVNRSVDDFKTIRSGQKTFIDYPLSKNKDFAKLVIEERKENGLFTDIFDLIERVVDRSIDKPIMEMTEDEKRNIRVNIVSGINDITMNGALDNLVPEEVVTEIFNRLPPYSKGYNRLENCYNEVLRSTIDATVGASVNKVLNPFDNSDFEYSIIRDFQKAKNFIEYENNHYGNSINFLNINNSTKNKPNQTQKRKPTI